MTETEGIYWGVILFIAIISWIVVADDYDTHKIINTGLREWILGERE